MSTSNTPLATIETHPKNYKNAIIATLAVALVATAGFFAYDRSGKTTKIDQQQTEIVAVTTLKKATFNQVDASLARLDSMGTVTNGLNAELTTKNAEIVKAKRIRSILNQKECYSF